MLVIWAMAFVGIGGGFAILGAFYFADTPAVVRWRIRRTHRRFGKICAHLSDSHRRAAIATREATEAAKRFGTALRQGANAFGADAEEYPMSPSPLEGGSGMLSRMPLISRVSTT